MQRDDDIDKELQFHVDERVADYIASGLTPAEVAQLGRLAMLCRVASVNEQGKLLVPKELSEAAGISAESEVVLAGRDLHFEVWSKHNHARVLEIEMTPDAEDDLGIL